MLWSVGYVFTWLSKWIICDLLTDADVFKSAIEQIKYRSVGSTKQDVGYLLVLIKHISFSSILTITVVMILDTLFQKKKIIVSSDKKAIIENKPIVLFTCLIPVMCCIVTFNHFMNHTMFSYRNIILIVTFILLLFFKKRTQSSTK